MARLISVFDPSTGEKIDQALATFFEGPRSYTGEDLVELSVHGGRSVSLALAAALSRMDGVRAAEPGEFTRRAYSSGKFDLSQAEAIADLIDSETEFQRRQALRLLDGGLGRKAERWRARILSLAVAIESELDFSDEGDVSAASVVELVGSAEALADEITREVLAGERSMALRNGFTVVIAGPPNAGKSTLFNMLCGSEIAIVTEYAGTTRDLIKVDLDLDGVPVTIVDSAGIHDAIDPVEKIGIARARSAISGANLVLYLQSADAPKNCCQDAIVAGDVLDVWSKADICGGPAGVVAIASNDSDSISTLVAMIRRRAEAIVGDGSEGAVIRERHREALAETSAALRRVVEFCKSAQLELAAEECRLGNACLGRVSGSYGTEELLGEIFAQFCIGK